MTPNPRVARHLLRKAQGSLYNFDAAAPGMSDAYERARGGEATDGDDEGPPATTIAEARQGETAALDVPQQAPLPPMEPEELESFPPQLTAAPLVEAETPRQLAPSKPAASFDSARDLDADTALARGLETAGRQLVAGISRTPVLDTITEQTNAVGNVRAARKSRAEQLRQAAEMARRVRMDDSTIESQEADRIEKLARAAALSREKRGVVDPTLPREKFEQQKVVDALKDERERARIAKMGTRPRGKPVDAAPEKDVQELAKRVGTTPARIVSGLDALDAEIAKYGNGDIPGIGRIDSMLPDFLQSDEGLQIQAQAKSLANTLLQMQSGQGVSNQERENTYRLYGIGAADERAFREGFKRLRRDLEAELETQQAGFKPEVVKKFESRGGTTTSALDKTAPAVAGEKVEVTSPTGVTMKVSAKTAALLKAGKVPWPK